MNNVSDGKIIQKAVKIFCTCASVMCCLFDLLLYDGRLKSEFNGFYLRFEESFAN